MWIVQIITYEDDYKHRYDSGVYPQDPELFDTYEEAAKYLSKYLYDAINEHLCDYTNPPINEEDKQYFKYEEDCNPQIKEEHMYDLDVMEELDYLFNGEFVDKWLTSEIYEKKPKKKVLS